MLMLDACPSLLTLAATPQANADSLGPGPRILAFAPERKPSVRLSGRRAVYRERDVRSSSTETIDRRLDAVAQQPFRARFQLRGRERALVQLRGVQAIRRHAHDVITGRLAPAMPHKDGRQTPYAGHPVFVAQHATGTCCRSCLERNHQIARGHELTVSEHRYVVDVIMRWIEREIPGAPR